MVDRVTVPKDVHVLVPRSCECYKAKRLHTSLRSLGYPGGPNVITGFLGREEGGSEGKRFEDDPFLILRMEKGPWTKEYQ